MSNKRPKSRPGALLGVGLDNDDGHRLITTCDHFAILGGTAETHERMTETVVKTFEELKQRGKRLNDVRPVELADIIKKASPR